MRAFAALGAVLVCALSFASEVKEPMTLLTIRGKLLLEEPFKDESAIKKGGIWNVYKGDFQVINETLRSIERAEDMHHPAMSTKLVAKNVIMQCKFRSDASKWQGLSLDNGKAKEHVFRAMLNSTSLGLKHMSGMGPTTKGENIVEKKFKFDPSKWYTLIVELSGKEVCAQIPEANIIIYGESEGIDGEKDRFEIISGGEAAWLDELKIWEAEPNPKWPQIKAQIPVPAQPKKK